MININDLIEKVVGVAVKDQNGNEYRIENIERMADKEGYLLYIIKEISTPELLKLVQWLESEGKIPKVIPSL